MKKFTRKLFVFVAVLLSQCAVAENVNSFEISASNLQNGKVAVFTTGTTSITMNLSFFRYLNSSNNFENANINFKLVAYYPGGSSGLPVITDLSQVYNISNSDFTTNSPNYVAKSYTFTITYPQVQNNVTIALVWTSNQFPNSPPLSYNIFSTSYQWIPVTAQIPILNNTISFSPSYLYTDDVDIVGSTPSVASGGYTFEWIINDFSNSFGLLTQPIVYPQRNPPLWATNASLINYHANVKDNFYQSILMATKIQRKITNPSGAVSLSNQLLVQPPANSYTLVINDLPGNQKDGNFYLPGAVANFTISNPIAGVKYVWYYYHRYAFSRGAIELPQAPSIGISCSITVGTYTPAPQNILYQELLLVVGSDGSRVNFYFPIKP